MYFCTKIIYTVMVANKYFIRNIIEVIRNEYAPEKLQFKNKQNNFKILCGEYLGIKISI